MNSTALSTHQGVHAKMRLPLGTYTRDVTEIVLHDGDHVATLDHDVPRIFRESAAFIERLTA